ncbi:hypothetical protein LDC_0631 [sediment metagenome]|uniref:Uncharacterized protein n=1 Tax=sediment metagenome TaxID=749907 RepID=D9PGI4_9ZZZZ
MSDAEGAAHFYLSKSLNNTIPAVVETFNDSFFPFIFISNISSLFFKVFSSTPIFSFPKIKAFFS